MTADAKRWTALVCLLALCVAIACLKACGERSGTEPVERAPLRVAADSEEAQPPTTIAHESQRAVARDHVAQLTLSVDDALRPYVERASVECTLVRADQSELSKARVELEVGRAAEVALPPEAAGGALRLVVDATIRQRAFESTTPIPLEASEPVRVPIQLSAQPLARGIVQNMRGEPIGAQQVRFADFGFAAAVDPSGAFALGPLAQPVGKDAAKYMAPRVELDAPDHRLILVTPFAADAKGEWEELLVIAGRAAALRVIDERPPAERGRVELRVTSIVPFLRTAPNATRKLGGPESLGLLAANAFPRYEPSVDETGAYVFADVVADVGLSVAATSPKPARYGWIRGGGVLAQEPSADTQPLVLQPGETRTATLPSARATVVGWVVDKSGKAVRDADIVVERSDRSSLDRCVADGNGRFSYECDDDGVNVKWLRFSAFSGWMGNPRRNPIDTKLLFQFASPVATVRLDGSSAYEVRLTVEESLFIRGRVVDEHGVPQRGFATAAKLDDPSGPRAESQLLLSANLMLPTDGTFRLGPLAAGDYRVTIAPPLAAGLGILLEREAAAGADLGDVVVPTVQIPPTTLRVEGIQADASLVFLWVVPDAAVRGGIEDSADPLGYLITSRLPHAANETVGGTIGTGIWSRQFRMKQAEPGVWIRDQIQLLPGRYAFLVVGRAASGGVPPTLLGPAEVGATGAALDYEFPAWCSVELANPTAEASRISLRTERVDELSFLLPDSSVAKRLELAAGGRCTLVAPNRLGLEIVATQSGAQRTLARVPAATRSWSASL
ncbi:MAG: hypothetical protein EPO68_01780 [Planctomycetota bacterium]|nr:MAG: hypothetical protein EPO68_01780 [Planctomycetota bacterium]